MTARPATADVGHLRRIRSGARATLVLGIGASLAANVLAADPSLIGRIIAAWSPLALLLTVELLSRVPASSGWLSRLRIVAAGAIAGIAAWVSYWHMTEVALTYGEATVAAHLLPLSVDGLVVVASVCLLELGTRITDAEADETARAQRRAARATTTRTSSPATSSTSAPTASTGRARRSVKADVHRLAAQHPDWTQAQLAERLGCSERTVRRHLANPPAATDPPASSTPDPSANGSTQEILA